MLNIIVKWHLPHRSWLRDFSVAGLKYLKTIQIMNSSHFLQFSLDFILLSIPIWWLRSTASIKLANSISLSQHFNLKIIPTCLSIYKIYYQRKFNLPSCQFQNLQRNVFRWNKSSQENREAKKKEKENVFTSHWQPIATRGFFLFSRSTQSDCEGSRSVS